MKELIHFCTKVCVAVCCELWLCHNNLEFIAVIATIVLLAIELKLFLGRKKDEGGEEEA